MLGSHFFGTTSHSFGTNVMGYALIAIIAPGALLVGSQNTTTLISSCAVPSVDLSTSNASDFLSLYTSVQNISYRARDLPASSAPQTGIFLVLNEIQEYFAGSSTVVEYYSNISMQRNENCL